MRTIRQSSRFRKDFKREARAGHGPSFLTAFEEVITSLAADAVLPGRFRDHALSSNWDHHRDCHLRPDLVLIYRKVGEGELELVRLGSHSELDL